MKHSKSSKAWLHEHVNDHYVHRAKAEGYRSRAAFKLLEIDERDRLLRNGLVVVDLGSAPGSWSQVAVQRVGASGRVIALDVLPMEPLPGVEFIQGDFLEQEVLEMLEKHVGAKAVGLVICDIAPNISGVPTVDQARSINLCELALDFACAHLAVSGAFLVKVFQGEGFDEFRKAMQARFKQVQVRKPKASRDRSSEVYLLGTGLKSAN